MKRDIIEGTCTCLGRASRSSYQRCWKLRDLRDSHHHHHQIIASLHFTTPHNCKGSTHPRLTRCEGQRDAIALAIVSSFTRSHLSAWSY